MTRRRRSSISSALIVVCSLAGGNGGGGGGNGAHTVTGFLVAPRSSNTLLAQPGCASPASGSTSCSRISCESDLSSMLRRQHRRPTFCSMISNACNGDRRCSNSGSSSAARIGAPSLSARSITPIASADLKNVMSVTYHGRQSMTALSAKTAAEMDAEWEAILASEDEEEDEDEDDDDDEQEHTAAAYMTDEELLSTDAREGGDLENMEMGHDGEGQGGAQTQRKRRVRYDSYKERMKAEKAEKAARMEKRSALPKKHLEYLDEMQRNRDIAAARREKYTKKFFRRKKLYDIIRDKGKKAVREATWATRWPRVVTRKLEDLKEGDWLEGKVRNVESYGAWVDVNSERDGLLHVRDMSDTFAPMAKTMFATKDEVRVRVKFVDPATGKLGLSLVEAGPREGDLPLPPPRPSISVKDVSPGSELWGYVERVTQMGAYVNVGAEVPGFLLLNEIPGRPKGLAAPQVLRRNKRLRMYAREVDHEGMRIKLTCKRPRSKPRCGRASALASDFELEEFEYDDTAGGEFDDTEGLWGEGEGDEFDEDDSDDVDDDDDEGGDWFYPNRGEVIPAPEENIAVG